MITFGKNESNRTPPSTHQPCAGEEPCAEERSLLGRRQIFRLLTGTALGVGATVGLATTGRAAHAQSALLPAHLDQEQTFTAVQRFTLQTDLAHTVIGSKSPAVVPLTVQLAPAQTADALQVRDPNGGIVASLSKAGDIRVNRVIARTPPWTGAFSPPITFDSDPSMGWMAHPAHIGSMSYVHKGREGFRFSADGQNSQMQGLGTNRMTLLASSAMILATGTGHFEFEGPGDRQLEIVGYQIATAIGKTVVFATEPQSPAVPLAVRGSGNVNVQEWRNEAGDTGMAIDRKLRLKFPASAQSASATPGKAHLPSQPVGFFSATDANGNEMKIPYYAA